MSNLLREYIKQSLFIQQLNEAKKETPELALLSNQVIGFASEWAVYAALFGGAKTFTSDMQKDTRIAGFYNGSNPQAQNLFNGIYRKLIAAATASKTPGLGKTDIAPGSGTRPVDVESSNADIHVKYNDDKRLAGFQRDKEEKEGIDPTSTEPKKLSGTATARIFDASLNQYLQEIVDDANDVLKQDVPTSKAISMLRDEPRREKYYATGVLRGRKAAKKAGKSVEFEKIKRAYAQVVKLGPGRQRFLEILEEKGIKKAILQDINKQVFNGVDAKNKKSKSIVFAKFTGGPEIKNEIGLQSLLDNPKAYKATCNYVNYQELLGLDNPLKDLTVIEVPPKGYSLELKATVGAAIEKAAAKNDKKAAALVNQPDILVAGQTTTYYLVVNKKTPSMIYFMIEFRLDGDGHPPQLKTGSALKPAK